MLTSCAAGVTVCNIDNGFGAAFAVLRILNSVSAFETQQQTEEMSGERRMKSDQYKHDAQASECTRPL